MLITKQTNCPNNETSLESSYQSWNINVTITESGPVTDVIVARLKWSCHRHDCRRNWSCPK